MSGLQTRVLRPSTLLRGPPGGGDVLAARAGASVGTHGAGRGGAGLTP